MAFRRHSRRPACCCHARAIGMVLADPAGAVTDQARHKLQISGRLLYCESHNDAVRRSGYQGLTRLAHCEAPPLGRYRRWTSSLPKSWRCAGFKKKWTMRFALRCREPSRRAKKPQRRSARSWVETFGVADGAAVSAAGALAASLRRAAIASRSLRRCPRRDAKLLQVFSRQVRQNRVVDVVLAENSLVLSEAQAPQPDRDVHDEAPSSVLEHIRLAARDPQQHLGLAFGYRELLLE